MYSGRLRLNHWNARGIPAFVLLLSRAQRTASSPNFLHLFGVRTLHVLLSFDLNLSSGSNGRSQQHHPETLLPTPVRTVVELEWELTPQTLKVEAQDISQRKILEYCCTKKIEGMK